MKLLVRLAWRNVIRNWRHSTATIAAIAAGFAAVSLFDGFIRSLQKEQFEGYAQRGMLGDVIIQRKDAQHKLIEDLFLYSLDKGEQTFIEEYLKKDPDVRVRTRFLSVS